jgi:hypothetical protein
MGGQCHAPGRFTPGKNPGNNYWGGGAGRCGRVLYVKKKSLLPTGFRTSYHPTRRTSIHRLRSFDTPRLNTYLEYVILGIRVLVSKNVNCLFQTLDQCSLVLLLFLVSTAAVYTSAVSPDTCSCHPNPVASYYSTQP